MLNFGGFLSSNFWSNYRCQSSASVEDLLNSKECNVDKLLDDDDCLQEFKNYNDKLIKYFDHDKLKVLIDYITVMPNKDSGHNRGHKYPFISGEIFNCEINQLLDRFFEAPIKVKEAESEDKEKSDKDDKDSDAGDSDDEKLAEKKKTDEGEKEEQKEETQEGAATNLEEAAEKKDASPEQTATKEEGENPQALDENKEKSAEETKTEEVKAESPEASDDKKDADATTEEKKEEVKDEEKNTQEPESEEQESKTETKPAVEEKKESEPEEEASEKKADDQTTPLSTEASAIETLPTDGDQKEEEPENRFVLLDRLFLFIESTEEDLNPVLAGYFCKLVSLLISRKQKSLVPYIFSPGSTIIDKLLKHVYQKSISEVLNKLLTQLDSDFEPELQEAIHQKQQEAVASLISQLGPEKTAEHNLNTCTIIQDMFDSKEFFNILCKKENLEQIIAFATVGFTEGSKSSKTSSLQILNQIITSLNDKQNKKGSKDTEKQDRNMDEDDDDMIVQQKSDDEDEDLESNPNSIGAQVNSLVEGLKLRLSAIEDVLRPDHEGTKIRGSVTSTEYVPLGQQRLLTVELLHNMILLKKEVLLKPISMSSACSNILELVKAYPWNNFLQLKVMNLFTEVIEKSDNEVFRKDFLNSSGISSSLIEMGGQAWFEMESGRKIRNGFMNLVVQISNQIIKRADLKDAETDKKEDSVINDYLEVAGEPWKTFVDDELKKSNENNNKTLGGSTTQKDKESDNEDSSYDVQMEKIMARFTNFNQILSQGDSNQGDDGSSDDDENTQDEDKDDKKGSKNFDEDDDDDDGDSHGQDIKKSDAKAPDELVGEFCDNNYWDMGKQSDDCDVDSLFAELND